MLGAIIGDIAGSRFERTPTKSKDFAFLPPDQGCRVTDDSVMTLAVADAILACGGTYDDLSRQAVRAMRALGRAYPDAGYGGRFGQWLQSPDPRPYHSYGNGAAMRVSPCGLAAASLEEALFLADQVTGVTHDHPEGMKAARAVASSIYLARTGASMADLRAHIQAHYYTIDFTLDQIRPAYEFDISCQGSVPQAFAAFFESTDFEDAVRGAISLGGDSDTIGAITGSMAEAYYGVPARLRQQALAFLDRRQKAILTAFEARFPLRASFRPGDHTEQETKP